MHSNKSILSGGPRDMLASGPEWPQSFWGWGQEAEWAAGRPLPATVMSQRQPPGSASPTPACPGYERTPSPAYLIPPDPSAGKRGSDSSSHSRLIPCNKLRHNRRNTETPLPHNFKSEWAIPLSWFKMKLNKVFNSMMDEIEYLFSEQSRFVEDASHELKTPLTALNGHLSMLKRWGKNDKERLEKSLDICIKTRYSWRCKNIEK